MIANLHDFTTALLRAKFNAGNLYTSEVCAMYPGDPAAGIPESTFTIESIDVDPDGNVVLKLAD